MQRIKRRWWTWAVSLITGTVISGAVLSGAFQLAVLAVPSYRDDLAAWVGQVAGRPVQLGGVELSWRALSPRIELSSITLFSEDGTEQLSVERLSLGFGLRQILAGHWVPTRLELSGLRVAAEYGADGSLRIAGFEPGDETLQSPRREQWLRDLDRFERVRLADCELRLVHAGFDGVPLALRLARAQLERTGDGFEVTASLRLPPDRGGELTLEARVAGAIAQPATWRGRFDAEVQALQPQGWLRPWLLPGTQIGTASMGARVRGDLDGGRVSRARLELSSDALVLARAGVLSSAQRSNLVIDYLRNPRGWRLDVIDLSFDSERLLHGSLRADVLERERAFDVDADRVELTRLAPWLAVWRDAPEWLYASARVGGGLEGLVLRYRSPSEGGAAPRYSLRARLRELGLRSDSRFGLGGLSGELSADESGGRLQLANTPLRLILPAALDNPVEFASVNADLRWSRAASGWRVFTDGFGWRLASIEGHGRFQLDVPDDAGASPVLDLSASFAAQAARDAQPFMPRHWPASLKGWLDRAIIDARVPRGELLIRGPLADFPFHVRKTGEWQLNLEVADAALDYAPGWPQLSDVRARLRFRGNSLVIDADQASVSGNRVRSAEVRFDDFNDHLIAVRAGVDGELSRYYEFLRRSPLRKPLAGLLDHTRAQGKARVDLRLRIPLEDLDATEVRGSVALADAQLHYGRLDPPITGLGGELRFDRQGVTAESLTGQFADLPLQLRIDARDGTHGVVRGSFIYAPRADGGGASQFVPGFVRAALDGSSQWQLELPIGNEAAALVLGSDLVGTAVRLPEPLAKDVGDARPVRVSIGAVAQAPMRVGVAYGTQLAVDVILAAAQDAWNIAGLHARLGAAEVPAARAGSFQLDGAVARLDVRAWSGALAGFGDGGFALNAADIEAGTLLWGGQATRPTRVRYRPQPDGWQLDFSGEGAAGHLRWYPAGEGRVEARFERLSLELSLPAAAAAGDVASAPPTDPATLPALDLLCAQLQLGDAELGRVELSSARISSGLKLQKLRIDGGIATVDASGSWRRESGQSLAGLHFNLDSRDIRQLLVAFGYAPNLQAARSRFSGDLRWLPSATGLSWEDADGRIDVAVEQGHLRAVEPGASRVLGLINFYALPRRLTLKFDDVVGQGLAFDSIKGAFMLAGGDAVTDDLKIEAPSLRMEIRGRVGLAARDYDQRVTVYPDVSAGLTLGAVLLGGPAVGALVLLAQELLDKPLDQVSQFSYRIRGPWDNPVVEKLDATADRPG